MVIIHLNVEKMPKKENVSPDSGVAESFCQRVWKPSLAEPVKASNFSCCYLQLFIFVKFKRQMYFILFIGVEVKSTFQQRNTTQTVSLFFVNIHLKVHIHYICVQHLAALKNQVTYKVAQKQVTDRKKS